MELKKLTRYFFALLLFSFIGCQEDDILMNEQPAEGSATITKISFNQIKNDPKHRRVAGTVDEFTKSVKLKHNAAGRLVYNEEYGFYIDEENGIYIEDGEKHSYTFRIERPETGEKIENIVFSPDGNGGYKATIVRYDMNKDEYYTLTEAEIKEREVTTTEYGKPPGISDLVCTKVWKFKKVVCGCPEPKSELVLEVECHWTDAGGPGGPGGPGSGGSTSGGGGSSPDEPMPPPPLITTPLLQIFPFIDQLDPDQQQFWNNPANAEIIAQIGKFLNKSNFTEEAEEFAEQLIDALNNGQINDELIQDILIQELNDDTYYFDSDDSNDDYTGPKQRIGNSLTLPNGDIVSIQYGTTNDGVSADQEVAVNLVAMLKGALESANNNLPSNQKITSIFISATTNGVHSPTSNHSKGTALDISRINNVKMIVSGASIQVIKLQEGFDLQVKIRENFGPYFKHKTFPNGQVNTNWPVGGHKDHIHVSIQNN